VIGLTLLAMVAFAANSLLCRLALGEGLIDAASFTTVRMVSGALTLFLFVLPRGRSADRAPADWRSAALLFAYMACFSFAYHSLSAGTGALLLFGAVQLTMFVAALRAGERFAAASWAGLALALSGLVYLVAPGLTAPDPVGAALMVLAGAAWGLYSLLGRTVRDPLEATAGNFILAVPLVLAVSLLFLGDLHLSRDGLLLAALSGAVASGLGYVVWFAALKRLTATRAATVQLSVPAIAAAGGVLLLAEPLTLRLVLASAATLGGIAIVLAQKTRRRRP
jgi:drug/metabolite transporter (DMT)-like permease